MPLPEGKGMDLTYPSTSVTDISSASFHRLDITLAVAEGLSPNKPNLDMTLAVAEALLLDGAILFF